MTRKETARKNGSWQRVKPSTPTQGIDARMGEEEKDRKPNKGKKQGADPKPSYLDRFFASYDPHGSYGGPILKPKPKSMRHIRYLWCFGFKNEISINLLSNDVLW